MNVKLYDTDYVFLDENNKMVTWALSDEIVITADEDEVKECGAYVAIKCTDLPTEMQKKLIENIKRYQ